MTSMISDRIKLRIKDLKLKQVDLVRATGASKSTVHGWLNGYTVPKGKNLLALADALKVTPGWLLDGGELIPLDPDSIHLSDSYPIPSLLTGSPDKPFQKELLEAQNLDLESLYWMNAPDDSMSPSVREGDVLIVDISDREVKDGKVYVVRYGESLIIKRLFKRINGLLLRSDNTAAVPDETLPPNKQDAIEVVGRVVLRIGEL